MNTGYKCEKNLWTRFHYGTWKRVLQGVRSEIWKEKIPSQIPQQNKARRFHLLAKCCSKQLSSGDDGFRSHNKFNPTNQRFCRNNLTTHSIIRRFRCRSLASFWFSLELHAWITFFQQEVSTDPTVAPYCRRQSCVDQHIHLAANGPMRPLVRKYVYHHPKQIQMTCTVIFQKLVFTQCFMIQDFATLHCL